MAENKALRAKQALLRAKQILQAEAVRQVTQKVIQVHQVLRKVMTTVVVAQAVAVQAAKVVRAEDEKEK